MSEWELEMLKNMNVLVVQGLIIITLLVGCLITLLMDWH